MAKKEIKKKVESKTTTKPIKEKKPKVNKELVKLQEENKLLNEKIIRLSADLQNIKKRHEEEKTNICKYEGMDIIKDMLPVIDNFERAINLDDDNLDDEVSKFLKGFKMIYSNILNIFKKLEITEIKCLGEEFNPNFMEAVLVDHEDGVKENEVIDVMQKGYMYKDKLLRVAMVKVNK